MKYYKVPEYVLQFLVRNYLYNASCEGYFDPMEVLAANHRYCQEHKAGFNTLTKDYIERHFKEFEME